MLDRPLVIFGTGRNGSSAFHRLLASHPHLAWMSRLTDDFPRLPGLNRIIMRGLDVHPFGALLRRTVKAGECYSFWESYIPGFRRPGRDLASSDYRPEHAAILRAFERMLTPRRSRLLLKITGWPRLGFLTRLFEDGRFLHIYRDGRAVAASTMKVGFWRGREGPGKWRWGPLSPEHEAAWEASGRSLAVLAGIQWMLLMDAAEAAIRSVPPERLFTLRYEDLCAAPGTRMREVAGFCGLEYHPDFERAVRSFEPRNANFKWRRELSPADRSRLEALLAGHLERYGYEV